MVTPNIKMDICKKYLTHIRFLFIIRHVKHILHVVKKDGVFEMHNQIKKFREHKGISQGKLAEMCNVSRQTINAIENNKYDPSLELAFSIAFILDSTVDTLFIYQKTYRK